MATCNPSTIQATGKDFYRLSTRELKIVRVRLLQEIAGNTQTPSEIMAAGKDFYRLSDSQLQQVIDQLYCNYSGGGSGFPLDPPVGEDWELVSGIAGSIHVNMLSPCPDGAFGVITRYSPDGSGIWTGGDGVGCLDGDTIASPGSGNWDAQIAWRDEDSAQISDWSSTQTVSVP